jgi:hypothetical protein
MKYIDYIGKGGFNDNLCGIQQCIEYCQKFKRIILINGEHTNYKYNFTEIFTILEYTNIIYDTHEVLKILENTNLTRKKNELTFSTIDLNYDYKEDVIKYSHWYGDDASHKLIKNLKLTDYYINDIINKYNQIPKSYISIHIRNTDYKCNYKDFYNKNKEKIKNSNIFLATDSIDALNFFKAQNLKIHSFTKLPDKNIPYHGCNIDKKEIILNTISDLFLLALGNDFIFSEENKGGYYRLAYFLYQNKDILQNVINNKLLVKPKIRLFKKR